MGKIFLRFEFRVESLKTSDDVKQFFRDRCLPRLMKLFREFGDFLTHILFSASHGRKPTRIFAG